MDRKSRARWGKFFAMALVLAACNLPPATLQPTVIPIPPTDTPASVVTAPRLIPEIESIVIETIYNQPARARLRGYDTTYWPDGNIGFFPLGDQFRFFAANGDHAAVTTGTFDNPAAAVETPRLVIAGADPQFAYVAGGPVYRDPQSGLLIMFYHAEFHMAGYLSHASLGLAASQDDGKTFQNLGIILENGTSPDPQAPCCADMGGAPYVIKDGNFLVYFRDRMSDLRDIFFAAASAPVNEVVSAALEGRTSPWHKYYEGDQEPGLGGRSSPLEIGNPTTDWFSVSYNTLLERYIAVISAHSDDQSNYFIFMSVSEDGYEWSPRILLHQSSQNELTYPSIVSPDGDPLATGKEFYVYFISTPLGVYRWTQTDLNRITVTLTGNLPEAPHEWEFESDLGGWHAGNNINSLEIANGSLVVEPNGMDPYMRTYTLGVNAGDYRYIEARMKVETSGTAQFFFTNAKAPAISENASVQFPVNGSDNFAVYRVDLSGIPAWTGIIGTLRLDPIDLDTPVEIDYIRLLP